MSEPRLTTERLVLRLPRAGDAAELVEVYSDAETMRFIGDGSATDLAGTEQIGWGLARERWGRGYATEAAAAARDWALSERGATRLISPIRPGNERSVRAAETLGARYERDVEARGLPTRLYALER